MKNTLSRLMNKGHWLNLMLAAVIFCGCKGEPVKEPTIVWKSYTNFFDDPMPKGICRFAYQKYEHADYVVFQDSCHFYNVGDKLSKK